MNSNCISVKSNNASFLTKGIMWLALMVFSMVCAFMPVFAGIEGGGATALRVVGWAVFAISAVIFVVLLIRELRPGDAIVLDSRGFKENQHIDGLEVEWTNVSSVGIYGTKKSPLFGITLENNDIVIDKLRKRAADEMRDNIEENLPSILIPQGEVKMPLRELRDLFNRFIREARTLEDNNAIHKQKVNPFTTEDVLRAFGQLPKKEEEQPAEESAEAPAADESTKVLSDKAEESDDDFYASLRIKVGEKAAAETEKSRDYAEESDTAVQEQDPGTENIPDEMKEILAKAKSQKIAEIEKMLANKDVPYSAVRDIEEKAAAAAAAEEAEPEEEEDEDTSPDAMLSNATKVFDPVKPAVPIKGITGTPEPAEEDENVSRYYGREALTGLLNDEDDIDEQTVMFDSKNSDEIFVGNAFSRKTESGDKNAQKDIKLPPANQSDASGEEVAPGIVFINDD